jgi:acyl-CoA synthetase (NDP forming)
MTDLFGSMPAADDPMSRLMMPRSVAILGASTDPGKFSNRPLVYLAKLGFAGPVYPVNPEASEIEGYPCYRSVEEIPGPVDVAIIARPAAAVNDDVARCIALGIRAFVVFSAGFAEAGPEGAALQDQLIEQCRAAGAVLCGPNCTGIVDVPGRAALSFMTNLDEEVVDGGSVALVSGSGSIAAIMVQGRGRIFHSIASIGNEAVTTCADYIAWAIEQPRTSGVVAFVEAIRDPARLISALERARQLGKPIAILKAGRTEQSAEVAATHTGALIDDDATIEALFQHYNVIRANSLDELKTIAVLMHAGASRSFGPGIGVLTPSGGTAVLIVDEVLGHGMSLPALGADTRAQLQAIIPQATPANPMDVTGFGASSPAILARSVETMLADSAIDAVLVPMGGGVNKVGSGRAEALINAAARTSKLLVPIWQGATREQPGYDALINSGLPVMTDYAILTAALGHLVRHRLRCAATPQATPAADTRLPPAARQRLLDVRAGAQTALSEPEVKALFTLAGLNVPGASLFDAQGNLLPGEQPPVFPAVLKVVSRDIAHKSAVSGVAVVHVAEQLATSIASMHAAVSRLAPEARIDAYLVEEKIDGGLELMIGLKHDARYGTLASFGLGGTWANAFKGAVTTLLPLDHPQAAQLVRRFFASMNDEAVVNTLAGFIVTVCAIANGLGERLDVLEINPVKLTGSGADTRAIALDGVLTLQPLTGQHA